MLCALNEAGLKTRHAPKGCQVTQNNKWSRRHLRALERGRGGILEYKRPVESAVGGGGNMLLGPMPRGAGDHSGSGTATGISSSWGVPGRGTRHHLATIVGFSTWATGVRALSSLAWRVLDLGRRGT